MKMKWFIFIAAVLIFAVNVYADGDLTVVGNVGIGVDPTTYRLEVQSTDVSAVRTTTEKTIDQDLNGYNLSLTDTYTGPPNNSYGTNKRGWNTLYVQGSHQGSGRYAANLSGAWYQLVLEGSATYIPDVRAQTSGLAMKTSGTYTIYNWIVNQGGFTDFAPSTGTYNITNMATYQSAGLTPAGLGTYNVTNMFHFIANDWNSWGDGAINGTQINVGGMKIEKQTAGNNPMGIWLAGDGTGADLVLGSFQETKIYGASGDVIIDTAGNVGIGTTSPNYKLQVGELYDETEARANAWLTLSDGSLKTNLVKINNAVDKISRINGYYFNWKNGSDTRRHVGVIAQEVQKVLPEIVSEDSKGIKSLDYSKMTSLLIEAVKEQQKTIIELTGKVNKLEQEMKLKGTAALADIELN
ncbi:MAG TPA: tail fiber domain-containing protein [Nitrospirae bacterium]|nr:tail fiber domain-containing protein [Nitrospirota bacterium]